jgi:hypothetical protein
MGSLSLADLGVADLPPVSRLIVAQAEF